ncbi:MAG: PLP-dependent aspartate aminotransferase family protein [Bacteroidetes bacterium]|nr:PLP-dependent aspartate aminotransferase family protein [Bacteroidota bacterium]MBU2585436.1 PLP-dependent aspartate aminotransferase family protein [Bacteroidota bacterium]
MGFSTDAIHSGQPPDPSTGAVITPIFQTTTYCLEELGKDKGFVYSRSGNPTRSAWEKNIAVLEKGKYGLAFASGMSAIHAVSKLLKSGEHAIVSNDVYGGTYRLFNRVMTDYGLEFSYIDMSNLENLKAAIQSNTRLVFIESPTNPLLILTDIAGAVDICRERGILVSVDNTFMSPYFQNPLDLGADIVIHSSTKYLGGHSDVIGGVIVLNSDELHDKLKFIQNSVGAVPSPFDVWLLLRSTKTLAVRMERHNFNASEVANYLSRQKKIKKVIYLGLDSHPQNELAKKQMRGFGGMVTFEVESFEKAKDIMHRLKIFTLAESLGGVESLVCHPSTMTHASIPKEVREKYGLTDRLVRLSVGIEDVEDLINDLDSAIN